MYRNQKRRDYFVQKSETRNPQKCETRRLFSTHQREAREAIRAGVAREASAGRAVVEGGCVGAGQERVLQRAAAAQFVGGVDGVLAALALFTHRIESAP